MGITVDIKPCGGALLSRYVKNQHVFIPRESWLRLIILKDTIQATIDSKNEERWSIGNDLYVNTSLFNDGVFLHIRAWWNDRPTKQGVSFPLHEWHHLSSFLNLDDGEVILGISVFQNMLNEAVGDFIKKNCEGCLENLPSQRDHACLMVSMTTAQGCVDRHFHDINVYDFITKLSERGGEEKVLIKKPYQTFHLIKIAKEDELKEFCISTF